MSGYGNSYSNSRSNSITRVTSAEEREAMKELEEDEKRNAKWKKEFKVINQKKKAEKARKKASIDRKDPVGAKERQLKAARGKFQTLTFKYSDATRKLAAAQKEFDKYKSEIHAAHANYVALFKKLPRPMRPSIFKRKPPSKFGGATYYPIVPTPSPFLTYYQ